MDCWNILGIKLTADKKQIKKAYAKLLKLHKPEDDPEGYQRLRDAFDQAIQYCKQNSNGTRVAPTVVAPDSDRYKVGSDRYKVFDEVSSEDLILVKNINENEQFKKDERDRKRQYEAQERLLFQQRLESKAEQRRIKEQQEQLIADELKSILLNILSLNDKSEAISAFQLAINMDILLNIKNRKIFERMCFCSVIEWDSSRCFPSELFMQVALEFEWYDKSFTDPYFLENIYKLQTRISAGVEYQALVELAKKSKHFTRENSDVISKIDAAKIILGAYRPLLFNMRLFVDDVPDSIKNILYTFTEKYPLESCPEINNESFRWWLRHYGKQNYTLAHVFVGAILALFVVFGVMDHINEPLETVSLTLISVVSTIAGSVASWWAFRFVSYYWKRAVPVIKEALEEIEANPYLYYGFTVTYVLLFMLSAHTDDLIYSILWFCLASMLVLLVLGSYIFLIGINAITFFIVSANMEVLIPHQAFNYLFIYVGIASYYVWLGIMRKLPSRLSEILTDRFIGIFTSLVIISASFSYLSLVMLNAIY